MIYSKDFSLEIDFHSFDSGKQLSATVIYFKDFNLEIDFHTFKLLGVYFKNFIFPNSMYNTNKKNVM